MKIELKNISFNERMSEETNCFIADLYINGVKAGQCQNQGHGGCTDYYGIEKRQTELIRQAEEYCKTLPDIDYGSFKIKNNLEHTIDRLFENWLKTKEQNKMRRKMKTCILVGSPDEDRLNYGYYNFKRPLSSIPKAQLQASIERIKTKIPKGEVILNTNLKELGIEV